MEKKLSGYFSGELEQSAISELFNELKTNDLLREEFVRLQNIRALTHLSELSKNESEGRRSYQVFLRQVKTKKRQKVVRLIARYVAAALVLIASTFFATRYLLPDSGNNGEINTLVVPAGQRAQITLQDGTSVWLNAQSTLTYPARFSGKSRRVTISGEAYFDVAENSKMPFIVSTQNIEMEVLGTQFNVYSYPDAGYIQTDLIEGSVKIYDRWDEQKAVVLKPNQQVTIRNNKMVVEHIVNAEHLLWKDGIYSFYNERLIDIIERLQLYYDVTIDIKDPEIFNVPYTGKFRQRDGIDEILRIIQKIQNFNIEKNAEKNIITLRK